MKLKSVKKPLKHDVWVTEVNVKDKKVSKALNKLLMLVKKYEDLS
jgi:hypothetical protein